MIHKIIARDRETKRQYKKWVYYNDKDFHKYSPDIIKRYKRITYSGPYDMEYLIWNDEYGTWFSLVHPQV